jgi:broad specificity phosphatase PhoE
MTITLVRHGEVEEAFKGKYNGHSDIALSPYGKSQAKELGKKLQKENFDKIYCSDLRRTRETLKELNLNTKTIFSEKLREKSWGIHEGKSFDEIEAMGIKYRNFTQWIEDLDGEDATLYKERIREYFYGVIAKEKAQNILVVTHAGVISTLLSIVNKCSLEEAFNTKIEYTSTVKINLFNSYL